MSGDHVGRLATFLKAWDDGDLPETIAATADASRDGERPGMYRRKLARSDLRAALVELKQLRERAETAEDELARQRKANRDVAKQCMDAMERATTAKRELAEMRERIGEAKVEWYVRWPTAGGDYHYELCLDEADARESVPDGDEVCEVVSRVVGEWKVADDG